MEVTTRSAAETQDLGRALARVLEGGAVLALDGDLGAGKTTLVQGLVEAMGAPEPAASPTFVLMRIYQGRLPLYHFDAYRLEGAHELADFGADEYFWGDGVSLVEWAERIREALPPDRLDVHIEHVDEAARRIKLEATGPLHARMLGRLVERYGQEAS